MSRTDPRSPATRRAPPKLPRHPDGELINQALKRLTASPEWQVFLDHYKAREFEAWFSGPDQEPGALLRAEGRRSFLRELEGLAKKVTDDDRSDHRE